LVFVSLFIALCMCVPYLQVIEWTNKDDQNCPNFGNGGDGSAQEFSSAQVYEISNHTNKKRENEAIAPGCVTYSTASYGINDFNTSITPKNNHTLAFAYSVDKTNVTVVEYQSTSCQIGTETGRVLRRSVLTCYKSFELGNNVSRWFQLTQQIPPGYTNNNGPTNFFNVKYYQTDVTNGGCGILVKNFQFANDQQCHQLNNNLYIKGYCATPTSFSGSYFTSADCTTGESAFGNTNVNHCYNDFNPFFGQFCIGGVCTPAGKVLFTCSSSSLMFNFVGLFAVLLALITLV